MKKTKTLTSVIYFTVWCAAAFIAFQALNFLLWFCLGKTVSHMSIFYVIAPLVAVAAVWFTERIVAGRALSLQDLPRGVKMRCVGEGEEYKEFNVTTLLMLYEIGNIDDSTIRLYRFPVRLPKWARRDTTIFFFETRTGETQSVLKKHPQSHVLYLDELTSANADVDVDIAQVVKM